jgi:VanZ family protein
MEWALWALTASCAGITLWFSFGAAPPGASMFPGADKVGHAIAYFATTLSFLFAAVWRPGATTARFPRMGRWFPVAAIAVGGLIEILQGMTPTRSAQFSDLVAEIIGTTAAVAVHATVRWRVTSRRANDRPSA